MAIEGKTGDLRTPWPKGDLSSGTLYPIYLGFGDIPVSITCIQMIIIPFKANVKEIWVGTGAHTGDPQIAIVTTEASAQTIVTGAAIAAATATDPTKLTIADEGPILAGTALKVTVTTDSDDTVPGLALSIMLEVIH